MTESTLPHQIRNIYRKGWKFTLRVTIVNTFYSVVFKLEKCQHLRYAHNCEKLFCDCTDLKMNMFAESIALPEF